MIIEPSPVIQHGIKKILEEDPTFTVASMHSDLQSFRRQSMDKPVDAILINPSIISFYQPTLIRDLFPGVANVVLVAIHYGYVDSRTLADFAGVLNIYDEGATMRKRLHGMMQPQAQPNGSSGENIDLSDREKEILVSVAKGLTNKEIAVKHHISIHTVISHRKNITRKTGIKTVSGLTVYAVFSNLVLQDDLLPDTL